MDTAAHPTDGVAYGGRFQSLRPLKSGRGTATLLGRDLQSGDPVIIKTATGLAPEARLRLEHEARVLGEVAGPDFTPVIEYGHQDSATDYVVMPFVPGVTLRERLNRGRLSLPDMSLVGRALAGALERAHERGVIHRDVKPSNVIVNDGPALSSATLIDFGFARSACLDFSIRDISVGTVHYLAPEQAGLLSRPVDERSDLYAVGIVLFECAAGRVPFPGESAGEILRAHLCARPPGLRSVGCEVPRALDEIIQRLLRKDPDDRYQTAAALSADLAELSDGLARGVADPVVVVGIRDRRQTLAEPSFVGRDDELARLDAHFVQAHQGRGGLVFVEAESGGGKTRLLEEFAQRCIRAGAWVLRGQAVDEAAVRPFQLLDGAIQGLVTRLETDTEFAEHLRNVLGEHREAVCEAVPQLGEYLKTGTSGSLGQEAHGEVRSLRALTALLDGLGVDGRPVVIVLDDAQWADDLTFKLLDHRQRRVERSEILTVPKRALIVTAFRREDVPVDHRLRGIPNTTTITLAPFSAEDLRRLVESMAGQLPDEAVDLIVRLADGSPFMASAVLQGLVEIGALLPAAAGSQSGSPAWRVDPHAMEEVGSSRRAGVLLAHRLDRLSAATRKVLSVGAVLGKEFALGLAGDLAGLPEHEAAAGCRDAARRHLIWVHDNGARCVFVHDKIREALLNGLSDDERRVLHAAAAATIEAEDTGRVFELAYHFDAAGQSDRALPYAIAAAEQARARYSLEVAEQQYGIAERGLREEDRTTRFRVAEGLGDVLMLRGKYQEADAQLGVARRCASDCPARARIAAKLGELALKLGDVKSSARSIESGLRALGKIVPTRSMTFLPLAIWEGFIQLLHTLLPSLFVGRRSLEGADAELLAIRLYSRLAYAYYFFDPVRTIWAHLRELNLAERYPATRELGQAYSNHAPCMTMIPWLRRGIRYAERSLAIRRALGDVWGQGQTLGFYGGVLLAASKLEEAAGKLREAVSMLDRAGDRWEANGASLDLAASLYRLGSLQAALDTSRRTYRIGLEIGEPRALGGSLDFWARASGGCVPQRLVHAELQRSSDDVQTVSQVLLAEGIRLLGEGRPLEAVDVLARSWDGIRRSGLRNEEVAAVLPWRTTALRTAAEMLPTCSAEKRQRILRRARRSCRQAIRLARRFRNNLPQALREAGFLAAMRGKSRKARACFDESLAVAAQQGAKVEHAQTLWARGRVGSAVGWSDAAADLEQGRTALHALGAYWVLGEEAPAAAERPVTPALIERFDALLQAGRSIASALTRDAVWAAVRDAALALLRGEECVIVRVAGGDIHVAGVRSEKPESRYPLNDGSSRTHCYSQRLVKRAMETRRPVVISLGLGEDPSESAVLSGARSVLCAPIAVRGEVVACFYVTHRHVDGLFGPDEERLAEFIATLAGAALENVEGVAKAESAVIAGSTAGLAHALKNPVAVLRGYLGMLRGASGQSSGVLNQYLSTMEGALDRINELVDRLQSVPVGSSAKTPVEIARVLDEAVAEVSVRFSGKAEFRIAREIAPDAPAVIEADGEDLRLVLVNLLVNAHQAMPNGGRVGIAVRAGFGSMIEIAVTDEGCGISPSIEARLFEPFVTSKADGTGLGLWVCKKIVEDRHQGRIEVRGVPGGGTAVRVTLPVGRDAVASPP